MPVKNNVQIVCNRGVNGGDNFFTRSLRGAEVSALLRVHGDKGLLGYDADKRDSRVYHYFARRTREECLREKSRDFVNAYFRGSRANAVASFLRDASFTDGQIRELEQILESRKGGGQV